ncbi:MAG: hypothetical protein A4E40_00874 [Methanoregulaceae archaeon PtaU1.Bin059]|nr:MAG: hypothetical protein A4E39_01869 [Methanoregulaceae archaeon PtaB.Bin152]OPY40242.1 MAG: hypothetical protein A4E40_00874 [Methanoregulaceae archaeon PtaU1.Bin059]
MTEALAFFRLEGIIHCRMNNGRMAVIVLVPFIPGFPDSRVSSSGRSAGLRIR